MSIPAVTFALDWKGVTKGKKMSFSGMAFFKHENGSDSFLVVYDNKKKDEGRFALINIGVDNKISYTPLAFDSLSDNDFPVDLEAITLVPGTRDSFLALASEGKVFYVKIDASANKMTLLHVFDLPNRGQGNYEAMTVYRIHDNLLITWAHRGNDEEPARLYWSLFDLQNYTFSSLSSETIKVYWPQTSELRHISEMKIDSKGYVYITSASDQGDNGPYDSAFYLIGKFSPGNDKGEVFFKKQKPFLKRTLSSHKVEAFDFFRSKGTDNVLFGTDDENQGGWVFCWENYNDIRNNRTKGFMDLF